MGQPNNRLTLEELKQQCPLPTLMEHLNLGDHAKPNCKSPFRRDEQGAWGIFQTNDGWRFKDHLTGDSGDEVTFLANLLNLDDREHFPPLMGVYRAVALRVGQSQSQHPAPRPAMIGEPSAEPMFPPDRTGFGPGTEAQRKQLADLQGFSIEAVNWAAERGVLVFGEWRAHHCYGICDKSARLVEILRLDGQRFPATVELPQRESHTLENSQPDWPVGLLEAESAANILLVEGVPDFIAAHEVILAGNLKEQWAPVAMRSASAQITREVRSYFKGKRVVIFYRNDASSSRAAQAAFNQLQMADNTNVTLFDTQRLAGLADGALVDLNDYLRLTKAGNHPQLPPLHALLSNP